MALRKLTTIGLVLLLPLVVTACTGIVQSLNDLVRLRAAIMKEFGEEGVDVKLNNNAFLRITFINSPLNAKQSQDRAQRAQDTALLVKKYYHPIDKIEEIWVGFAKQETRYVFVTYTEGLDVFTFDRDGQALNLERRGDPIDYGDEDGNQPLAVYSATRNQTDISITRVQLRGNLNDGLTLVPHFTLGGDATTNKSKALPAAVSFDFASFSREANFPGDTSIELVADGKLVFKLTRHFFGSRRPDGSFSEYLHVELTYEQFRQFTEGHRASIVLGKTRFDLTDEQLGALRAMRKYVQEKKS